MDLESELLAIFGGHEILMANGYWESIAGLKLSKPVGIGVGGSARFSIKIGKSSALFKLPKSLNSIGLTRVESVGNERPQKYNGTRRTNGHAFVSLFEWL